jgi:hypothetical protein
MEELSSVPDEYGKQDYEVVAETSFSMSFIGAQ